MRVGIAWTVALEGLMPRPVRVEARVTHGLPGFTVIGGPSGDTGERVRAALAAVGHGVGQVKVLVNLAPADVRKRGARFDLPIAVAVLRSLAVIDEGEDTLIGELSLAGEVRGVSGVLPSLLPDGALGGRAAATSPPTPRGVGSDAVVVPWANRHEARLAGDRVVVGIRTLRDYVDIATGTTRPERITLPEGLPEPAEVPDLADVAGQPEARRALEVAASGGHHLLMIGPPGAGKSMLARRLPGILPPLTATEALVAASVRSLAGRTRGLTRLESMAPFAAPHHSASTAALLGGGSGLARPGAVSDAAHGVLFLDELFEWSRRTLDALREPMEEGVVRLARAHGTVTYPASFLLVAASNPCPCGPARGGCRCPGNEVARYRARLTGPLADRFDLAPLIQPVPATALAGGAGGEPSSAVAARVRAARAWAADRGHGPNATAPAAVVRQTADSDALDVLVRAVQRGRLSARGFDRALRVARTCADLAGRPRIHEEDAHEAVGHRARLDQTWEQAA
ncbi:YifB family Mg chelatase-like AAA ATPase [Euzebya tangerina]|uniref:YifB family Mg chelatase-like AAA ATPase n=1 Tax=Euzebya tangerina TaxID=591198 RepID=UPI000E31F922|nr:YifB family Mg chelatase-like AAA ATPase [Euzebya tangerina]